MTVKTRFTVHIRQGLWQGENTEELKMLPATKEETEHVTAYFNSQAPSLNVQFVQKVYGENVLSHRHEVWDVHTDINRWWVITNPTNLYSQEQFPNMDLALTFHVGLCLRIPRTEKQKLSDLSIEPFAHCYRALSETADALNQAQEVADYQSIGVRCREALLAFANVARTVIPWTLSQEQPKQADFKAWAEHICNVSMPGTPHEHRRHLCESLLENAWKFANWLTHAKNSNWYDAEAAYTIVEHAIGLSTSVVIRYMRGVPDACPACGSHRLSSQRGFRGDDPEIEWERPACEKCGWTGDAVPVVKVPEPVEEQDRPLPDGECVIPSTPLRELRRP